MFIDRYVPTLFKHFPKYLYKKVYECVFVRLYHYIYIHFGSLSKYVVFLVFKERSYSIAKRNFYFQ